MEPRKVIVERLLGMYTTDTVRKMTGYNGAHLRKINRERRKRGKEKE